MEFKVGDRVRWHEHIGTILEIDGKRSVTEWDDLGRCIDNDLMKKFTLVCVPQTDILKRFVERWEDETKGW